MHVCMTVQHEDRHLVPRAFVAVCSLINWRIPLLQVLTDLLNPEATHLLIREDVKKGIFVENLSSHVVHNSAPFCPSTLIHDMHLHGTLVLPGC